MSAIHKSFTTNNDTEVLAQSQRVGEMLAPILVETPPSQADTLGTEMRVCCTNIEEIRRALARYQASHEFAVARLAVIKARELVHGEYGEKQIIDLKPLAVQEAILLLSLDKNEAYLAAAENERSWRADVQGAEADLEYHRNRLAALRSQARLAAAEMEVGKCI